DLPLPFRDLILDPARHHVLRNLDRVPLSGDHQQQLVYLAFQDFSPELRQLLGIRRELTPHQRETLEFNVQLRAQDHAVPDDRDDPIHEPARRRRRLRGGRHGVETHQDRDDQRPDRHSFHTSEIHTLNGNGPAFAAGPLISRRRSQVPAPPGHGTRPVLGAASGLPLRLPGRLLTALRADRNRQRAQRHPLRRQQRLRPRNDHRERPLVNLPTVLLPQREADRPEREHVPFAQQDPFHQRV